MKKGCAIHGSEKGYCWTETLCFPGSSLSKKMSRAIGADSKRVSSDRIYSLLVKTFTNPGLERWLDPFWSDSDDVLSII
jgi:hypothetical protein